MKKYCIATFLMFLVISVIAQTANRQTLQELKLKEDTLKSYADKLINGLDAATRFKSDSLFTKLFVRALKTPQSFNHPFDSLITISKLYAPDDSFRIFTWQLV